MGPKMRRARWVICLLFTLAACSTDPGVPLKAYVGQEKPTSEIASLDPSGDCNAIRYEDIGGSIHLHPNGLTSVVFLNPGSYSISCFLYTDVISSLQYEPVFHWLPVQLEAGQSYKMLVLAYRSITMIDVKTGEIVAKKECC